jgi:hypothetical protein
VKWTSTKPENLASSQRSPHQCRLVKEKLFLFRKISFWDKHYFSAGHIVVPELKIEF